MSAQGQAPEGNAAQPSDAASHTLAWDAEAPAREPQSRVGGVEPAAEMTPEAAGPAPDEAIARRQVVRAAAAHAVSAAGLFYAVSQAAQRLTFNSLTRLVADPADGDPVALPPAGDAAAPEAPEAAAAAAASAVGAPATASSSIGGLRWAPDRVWLVDQRRLPGEVHEVECGGPAEVAAALRQCLPQVAPIAGAVGALGLAAVAHRNRELPAALFGTLLAGAASSIAFARPRARELSSALEAVLAGTRGPGGAALDGAAAADAAAATARAIAESAAAAAERVSENGLAVLPKPAGRPLGILTLGYTGSLATGGPGTALGVIKRAAATRADLRIHVAESRPRLEGARLSAWELARDGAAATVVPDAALGALLAGGTIDVVLVGAERIAANGDLIATVGTYPLAVLAARHAVPFVVCATTAALDQALASSDAWHADAEPAAQLRFAGLVALLSADTLVASPALDATSHALISALVTELGVVSPYTAVAESDIV